MLVKKKLDRRIPGWKLRRSLIESGRDYKCQRCGLDKSWNNLPITKTVHHIDGDWMNNQKENLEFLCPNCHSQTPNFGKSRQMRL